MKRLKTIFHVLCKYESAAEPELHIRESQSCNATTGWWAKWDASLKPGDDIPLVYTLPGWSPTNFCTTKHAISRLFVYLCKTSGKIQRNNKDTCRDHCLQWEMLDETDNAFHFFGPPSISNSLMGGEQFTSRYVSVPCGEYVIWQTRQKSFFNGDSEFLNWMST